MARRDEDGAVVTLVEHDPTRQHDVAGDALLMSGTQALVRLLVEQHRADRASGLSTGTFISGYPGSPLGGLDIELQRRGSDLREHDVVFVPGLNEELAATAVWGSQQSALGALARHDGVVGFWFGKSPGVDRCGDVFRHANTVGVGRRGGVVALAGDDPTAKSSTLPNASEVTFYDAQMPVLYPGNVQEVLDLGLHAVALSRYTGAWVGFKIVTNVADGFETVQPDFRRVTIVEPELELGGRIWRHEPRLHVFADHSGAERDVMYGRLEAAKAYAYANHLNRISPTDHRARVGLIAAGKTYYDVREALSNLGMDDDDLRERGIRILKLGMIYPLEPRVVREFAEGLEQIIVFEEKRSFIETFTREVLYGHTTAPRIIGKRDAEGRPLVPAHGEIDAEIVVEILVDQLGLPRVVRKPDPAPDTIATPVAVLPTPTSWTSAAVRTPFFCSGCPHNLSTVVPEGSVAGAGIGCHGMVMRMDRQTVSITQMGGEGASWIGRAPFTTTSHMFQNLGDGTCSHSGSLAIRACVAAGVNITYKILYNAHVSMTGGQEVTGLMSVPALTRALEAEGVARIVVCAEDPDAYGKEARWAPNVDVWHRDRLDEAQRLLRDIPGVTVIVYDQECAAERRRLRKRGKAPQATVRVLINESVCEGCGDCGVKSNCLSVHPVETELGRKTQIHQSSCNTDYSCLQGDCPSFVTIDTKYATRAEPKRRKKGPIPAVPGELPPPERRPRPATVHSVYMTGVGGTGVVTANQILASAAMLEGLHVKGLDQTGLSQKGGPVVSHLKISAEPLEGAGSVSDDEVDLYLGFDVLVAADAVHLSVANREHTLAVVSTTEVPTGSMVANPDVHFPELARLTAAIDARTRGDENVYFDAAALSGQLFGSEMPANLLVLGAAFQAGGLPLSAEAIERAIELNGVDVETNVMAFRWGRWQVVERTSVAANSAQRPGAVELEPSERAQELVAAAGLKGELARVAALRVTELSSYQSEALARRYLDYVMGVAAAEHGVVPGRTELSEAVARYLFKLMAYKDEYEVARLILDPRFGETMKAVFPDGGRVRYHLHPPMLRAVGWDRKIKVGPWFRPMFRALSAMRRVRGTPLDLFGYSKMRRLERQLIRDYTALLDRTVAELRPETYEDAVRVASLPDIIRGYESVKLANVERFRAEVAALGLG